MTYTIEMMEEKLQSYNALKVRLALLEYELEHPACVSGMEILRTLAYRGSCESIPSQNNGGHVDRVASLATSYQKTADTLNKEVLEQLVCELEMVYSELSKMDMCINMLEKSQRIIIQDRCIEKKEWKLIEQETGMSRRTLVRRKQEALKSLVEMYNFISIIIKKSE